LGGGESDCLAFFLVVLFGDSPSSVSGRRVLSPTGVETAGGRGNLDLGLGAKRLFGCGVDVGDNFCSGAGAFVWCCVVVALNTVVFLARVHGLLLSRESLESSSVAGAFPS
jgi:hypothetical protein